MHRAALVEMQRLGWRDAEGEVAWFGAKDAWAGLWERRVRRQGAYVSARQSMIAFVLDGEVNVELGPRRLGLRARSGDALVIGARTPFLYEMSAGTRFATTDVTAVDEPLGLRHVAARELPAALARSMARSWKDPAELTLHAPEVARRAGKRVPFEPIFNTERMLAVKRYLDEHFREPLRLGDVARRFKMDAFYLSRGFSRSIGVTPKVFLQALRREHFLRSLLSSAGKRRLTALAFEAGFDDYAAFCRFVRKELGTPPSKLLGGKTDQVLPSRAEPAAVACGP